MELNVKMLKLFSEKEFLISERTAGDVLAFSQFSEGLEDSGTNSIYRASVMIEDALKINFKKLKWYQIIKRIYFKRVLNKKYLIRNLTASQIAEISKEVLILEGYTFDDQKVSGKKKVK